MLMHQRSGLAALACVVLATAVVAGCARAPAVSAERELVALPSPRPLSSMSLDDAFRSRRSIREFAPGPLAFEMVGRLLWAAQGITSSDGGRTAPSAGALYPLDLYAVSADGVFLYRPPQHDLTPVAARDLRDELERAAFGQASIGDAALVIVITADYSRTATRYGLERGERYVLLEAGHVAQNILLEAVALGLGAVPIGAFDDGAVTRAIDLPASLAPLYLIAVGHKRSTNGED